VNNGLNKLGQIAGPDKSGWFLQLEIEEGIDSATVISEYRYANASDGIFARQSVLLVRESDQS
jgi:hypothetical protein